MLLSKFDRQLELEKHKSNTGDLQQSCCITLLNSSHGKQRCSSTVRRGCVDMETCDGKTILISPLVMEEKLLFSPLARAGA
jgi:hypothetical protein